MFLKCKAQWHELQSLLPQIAIHTRVTCIVYHCLLHRILANLSVHSFLLLYWHYFVIVILVKAVTDNAVSQVHDKYYLCKPEIQNQVHHSVLFLLIFKLFTCMIHIYLSQK